MPTGVPKKGAVETAVEQELSQLPQADARPALAQAALAMGRLLDSRQARSQHAQAVAKLMNVLDVLRKGADSRRSQLASVRSMTGKAASKRVG